MKDFFISYTNADLAWAEWIAWQLEEDGYSVVIQAWDFGPGCNFVQEMNRAAKEAQRTLAVLTPKYFESRFAEDEWSAAFAKGNLLPVRVADFNVEGLLSVHVYIDLVGKNEDQAKEALLTGVKDGRRKPSKSPSFPHSAAAAERTVTEQPRFPGALPPIWNIPQQRNPNFVGRDTLLDDIRKTLTAEKAAVLTAVFGLGGVGKTHLAAEYAYRHAADYQIVWWIRSEETATLAADYAALAEKLDLKEKHEREQPVIVAAVRDWLNHHADWLLIFDNARQAQDVRDYLPQNRAGHVLITSRDPNWGRVAHPLEVKVLPREESVKFLLQRTGQNDEAAARTLAADLGDLPLALEQAAAYIEATGESLADYRQMFQTSWQALMQEGKPDDYPHTIAVTWKFSFDKAQEESPAAAELLHLCAFLAPDDIPLPILRDGVEHLPPVLAEAMAEKLAFNKAIAALRRYSLMERKNDSLSVHRLVQMVARDRLPEDERRKWAEVAVQVVNKAFPVESDDVRTWPTCAKLLPHALITSEYGENLQLVPEAIGRLLNQIGSYLYGCGQAVEAKSVFERALRIVEAIVGPNHPYVAIVLSNLGGVLVDLHDLVNAHKYCERALQIDEASFGNEHINVARALNTLGFVLKTLNDLVGAHQCYTRSLKIFELHLGPNHETVAALTNNIGVLLRECGKLVDARQYVERALRIDKAIFGSDHPNVGRDLNNLGLVLHDLGDLENARQCFEQAFQISRKFLGEDHPHTMRVRKNLESLK